MQSTLTHLISRIEEGIVCESPFPHIFLENMFPSEVYAQMLSMLPPLEAYRIANSEFKKAEDMERNRYHLWLTREGLDSVSEPYSSFWRTFASEIVTPLFTRSLLHRFQQFIATPLHLNGEIELRTKVRLACEEGKYTLAL